MLRLEAPHRGAFSWAEHICQISDEQNGQKLCHRWTEPCHWKRHLCRVFDDFVNSQWVTLVSPDKVAVKYNSPFGELFLLSSEHVQQALEVIAFGIGARLIAGAATNLVEQFLGAAVDVLALQHVAVRADTRAFSGFAA